MLVYEAEPVLSSDVQSVQSVAYISDIWPSLSKADQDFLLHCRLGHLSADGIREMIKNGTTINGKTLVFNNTLKDFKCAICRRATQKRADIPRREQHSPRHPNCQFGEHLHSDCVVIKNTPTFNYGRYVLTVVDEKSLAPSIFIMQTEQKCLDQYKKCVERLKSKTGKPPKTQTFDRGTGFRNPEFRHFVEINCGSEYRASLAERPWENGIAECVQKLCWNIARCQLKHSGLADIYRGPSLRHAAQLLLYRPSSRLGGKSPIHEITSDKHCNLDRREVSQTGLKQP